MPCAKHIGCCHLQTFATLATASINVKNKNSFNTVRWCKTSLTSNLSLSPSTVLRIWTFNKLKAVFINLQSAFKILKILLANPYTVHAYCPKIDKMKNLTVKKTFLPYSLPTFNNYTARRLFLLFQLVEHSFNFFLDTTVITGTSL